MWFPGEVHWWASRVEAMFRNNRYMFKWGTVFFQDLCLSEYWSMAGDEERSQGTPLSRNLTPKQLLPHKLSALLGQQMTTPIKNAHTLTVQGTGSSHNIWIVLRSMMKIQLTSDCEPMPLEAWGTDLRKMKLHSYLIPMTQELQTCMMSLFS